MICETVTYSSHNEQQVFAPSVRATFERKTKMATNRSYRLDKCVYNRGTHRCQEKKEEAYKC